MTTTTRTKETLALCRNGAPVVVLSPDTPDAKLSELVTFHRELDRESRPALAPERRWDVRRHVDGVEYRTPFTRTPRLTRGGVIVAGPVMVRIGGIMDGDCYGCLGTGYVQGFGSRLGTECLHHHPDCDPDSCVPTCEHREHAGL